LLNRRIPNGTYGGVRGRSLTAPPTRFVAIYWIFHFEVVEWLDVSTARMYIGALADCIRRAGKDYMRAKPACILGFWLIVFEEPGRITCEPSSHVYWCSNSFYSKSPNNTNVC
ncbi:hypothetical protein, partial [Listeria rocourtiae]|uniref:hypothetical protein n=1 Tax=Listeria rocourtiae TaxID=647910 RepID=UPI003D2F7805